MPFYKNPNKHPPTNDVNPLGWWNSSLQDFTGPAGHKIKKTSKLNDQWKIRIVQHVPALYIDTLPSPAHDNTAPSIMRPKPSYLYLCIPQEPRSPIDEFVIGLYNPFFDDETGEQFGASLSIMAIAKAGVSKQVYDALIEKKAKGWIIRTSTEGRFESRFMAKLRVEYGKIEQMINFLEGIASISPFSEKLIEHLSDICMAAVEIDDNSKQSVEKIKNWQPQRYYPPYKDEKLPHMQMIGWPRIFSAASYRYDSRVDNHFPVGRPQLHQAVIDNNIKLVIEILAKDPLQVLYKDPWGRTALHLAGVFLRLEIHSILVNTKMKIPACCTYNVSFMVYDDRKHLKDPVRTFNKLIARAKKRTDQEDIELKAGTFPQRSALHSAAVSNELKKLKEILDAEPTRINEPDPWGYTLLIIALANGHNLIVEELIERGVSLEAVSRDVNRSIEYEPIYNAKTATGAKLLLEQKRLVEYGHSDKLHEALLEGDYDMLQVLLHYRTRKQKDSRGQSPLNNAFWSALQGNANTSMFRLMLLYHDQPLPEGEYNPNIPAHVVTCIKEHNQRLIDRRSSSQPLRLSGKIEQHFAEIMPYLEPSINFRAKMIEYEQDIEKGWIVTTLNTESSLKAYMKPVNELTDDERADIYMLAKEFFEGVGDKINMQDYLDKMFQHNQTGFIEVCKFRGRVISFSGFEILSLIDAKNNPHKVLHVQLAAAHPLFASSGLTSLILRLAPALKYLYPNEEVNLFCKAIRPGWGYVVLPELSFAMPKYAGDKVFLEQVVEAVGEHLREDGLLNAKLQVARKPVKSGRFFDFEIQVGKDENAALPVLWTITHEQAASLERKFAAAGGNIPKTALMLANLLKKEISERILRPKL